ncbi:MAG: MFS transporter [Eubacteriales bacterium]|nr:MFS transporter [Eubacteriales bacterium]
MKKLTTLEKSWILYDVGNSAFVLLVATIMPIYFNYLSESAGLSPASYLAYWGYAASVATLAVAVIGPTFGTLADTRSFKKPLFLTSLVIGAGGCLLLGVSSSWLVFLVIFVIAKIGYSASLVFYDSMINDVTSPDRLDRVSSLGFAWGYIGSCIPFLLCLGLVLGSDRLHISMKTAMAIAFFIVSLWWVGVTLPLLKNYRQVHYVEYEKGCISKSFRRLGVTLKGMAKNKPVFLFLLAYFFYIDGVYTIIDMATAYGTALGLDSTGLLLALLATQVVAFPFSILFGRLSGKYPTTRLIMVCILAYLGIGVFALFMHSQLQFWILAVLVGMFQGGIQALSRSHFARLIPAEKSGEYFGIMDICGKGASFLGTTMVGLVSQLTGDANKGVGVLIPFFLLGFLLFSFSLREQKKQNA